MIPPDTQRLLDFLSDTASYPHLPDRVMFVQTHASWVFIASPFVYKVKKPVNLGFLDFSTLALRQADCEREVELNSRLTDDIYLGVEFISDEQGELQFNGKGPVIEWVVKMREMESRFFLNELLKQGSVGVAEMDRIVDRLQRFYNQQSGLSSAAIEAAGAQLHQAVRDNLEGTRAFVERSLSQQAYEAIEAFSNAFELHHQGLLNSRAAEGRILDCHGDLHLEHIHLTPLAVNIYDCIEFNTEFRQIDVACDLAFLAMDLDFNGRPDLSAYLVQQFTVSLNDAGMARLMDFYKCYRACVRGKVESMHSMAETAGVVEQNASRDLAKRYYQLALRYAIAGSEPCALIFMGKVASGKSALAAAVAQETGWEVVSSDRTRKTLAAVPLHQRGSAEERAALYAAEMTHSVYDVLMNKAFDVLRSGANVIVDATFSNRSHRAALQQRLQEEGFVGIWIEAQASSEVAMERLRQREAADGVISDARAEDYVRLSSHYDPPDELAESVKLSISTNTESQLTIGHLLKELALRRAVTPTMHSALTL